MRISKKWVTPALAAIPALALALSPLPAGAGTPTAQPGAAAAKGVIKSPYQAGYEAVPKPGGTVTSFKYVQAEFTVPTLTCTSASSGVAQMVEVGGGNNFNGARIAETCQNGSPSYGAYGLSTCNGHGDPMIPTLTISAGDTIKLVASNEGTEEAFDLTTGAQASNYFATGCLGGAVAGALTQTFSLTVGPDNVANFTQVGFRQVQVQGSNQKGPQPLGSSAWNVAHYVLQGPTGRLDVTPEALLTGTYTSSFANDWYFPN